ncbi:hypothetical protein EV192_12610 [Actinocrispum wychmicini]|uniref:Uncharacterized protein n=1 Tax=Actinocrispum wychmicini TaxID=1213861 RepID=A0A4R2IM69_9PSEU|nr:hypothetical protein EV192_12610 [Actinocrispum wychmicini]
MIDGVTYLQRNHTTGTDDGGSRWCFDLADEP